MRGSSAPTLLVLAAGMGSRYGGLKQIDAMGPGGEWLLEYAIFDAARAGFGKVVFVVGRGFADAFIAEWERRCRGVLPMELVFQEMGDVPDGCAIPEGREKPLGTGHAIWCARNTVKGPFAVINADDFYGRDAFETLAQALPGQAVEAIPHQFSMVAYPLEKTLSDHGRVSRGVCQLNGEGELASVREHTHIYRMPKGIASRHADGKEELLPAEVPVSMNLWGFTPDIFPGLEEALRDFLAEMPGGGSGELFIPFVVDELIRAKSARIKVHRTRSQWFGVTYADDKPRVRKALQSLTEDGQYPEPLWQ